MVPKKAAAFAYCNDYFGCSYFFLPLPKSVIRLVAEYSATWLLNDAGASPAGLDGAMQKLTGETLQQSLISHFHSLGPKRQTGRDAAYAGEQLRRLRPMLINQSELYHNPAKGPMALSGLAWCDMANGLAGRLLAHDFDHVQIVGIRSSESGVGHSLGRFWSRQYGDWLYFDIWPEEVFVFRTFNNGDVEYLHQSSPLGEVVNWPADIAAARTFHAMVKRGFVHNELQPNVGSYFFHRIANLLKHGNTAPEQGLATLALISEQSSTASERQAPDANSIAINVYASARVEHFFGNRNQAVELYREAARLDRGKSIFGSAAFVFASRLERAELPSTKPGAL